VLVTGASTGIGRRITERLAGDGYFVYAGARKDSDLAELNAIENVQALRLDVTKPDEVAAAVEAVTAAGRGLHGLVNNAGVAITGPLSDTREEDFDFVMQVNVYGPYRVTKAFTPLIVAGKGRITTIGSISGILSPRDLGVYSMSKHAVEAFADSLALQMEPQGVRVSVVEPGNYNTEIGSSAARRTGVSRLTDRSLYKSPDEVADAVKMALFEPEPKRRYMVVPNAYEGEITIRKAIQELVELNEGHAYTYGRDALVQMLDEALATARPAVPAAPL
jgi:NAD(P)-dependent dehydrogenase (short-subunit alcohol dehydrogenase family)